MRRGFCIDILLLFPLFLPSLSLSFLLFSSLSPLFLFSSLSLSFSHLCLKSWRLAKRGVIFDLKVDQAGFSRVSESSPSLSQNLLSSSSPSEQVGRERQRKKEERERDERKASFWREREWFFDSDWVPKTRLPSFILSFSLFLSSLRPHPSIPLSHVVSFSLILFFLLVTHPLIQVNDHTHSSSFQSIQPFLIQFLSLSFIIFSHLSLPVTLFFSLPHPSFFLHSFIHSCPQVHSFVRSLKENSFINFLKSFLTQILLSHS